MMELCADRDISVPVDIAYDTKARHGVKLHQGIFLIRKPSGLCDDGLRNPDLSYVMKESGPVYEFLLLL